MNIQPLSATRRPWLRVFLPLSLHDRGLDFVFEIDHDAAAELINQDHLLVSSWVNESWRDFPRIFLELCVYYKKKLFTVTAELIVV